MIPAGTLVYIVVSGRPEGKRRLPATHGWLRFAREDVQSIPRTARQAGFTALFVLGLKIDGGGLDALMTELPLHQTDVNAAPERVAYSGTLHLRRSPDCLRPNSSAAWTCVLVRWFGGWPLDLFPGQRLFRDAGILDQQPQSKPKVATQLRGELEDGCNGRFVPSRLDDGQEEEADSGLSVNGAQTDPLLLPEVSEVRAKSACIAHRSHTSNNDYMS